MAASSLQGVCHGPLRGPGFVSAGYGFAHGFDEYAMNQVEMVDAHLAAKAGREAVEWIERTEGRPFFLFLHTYQVHTPYKSPDAIMDMFLPPGARWRSFDVVAEFGRHPPSMRPSTRRIRITSSPSMMQASGRPMEMIKPLLELLRRKGLYDQTMIVLTSDHGEEFYEHHGWNHTHSLYDELIKVPLIIKMPRGKRAGFKLDSIVRLTDIMPTILECAGAAYEPDALDGRSLLPVLEGKETADRSFQAEFADNVVEVNIPERVAVNEGRLKLILNQPFTSKHFAFFSLPPDSARGRARPECGSR